MSLNIKYVQEMWKGPFTSHIMTASQGSLYKDDGNEMLRRVIVINCEQPVPKERKDETLYGKMIGAEYPALKLKMQYAYRDLVARAHTAGSLDNVLPESIIEAGKSSMQQDPLTRFLTESPDVVLGPSTGPTAVYVLEECFKTKYETWLDENRYRGYRYERNKCKRMLRLHGVIVETTADSSKALYGVSFKSTAVQHPLQ